MWYIYSDGMIQYGKTWRGEWPTRQADTLDIARAIAALRQNEVTSF
jgi:hypothetical protein